MRLQSIVIFGLLLLLSPCYVACQVREQARSKPGTMIVEGVSREYRIFVPSHAEGKKDVPLVLVFHGGGGRAAQIERGTGFSELAEKEGFIVVYPQGLENQWNDGRRSPARRGNGTLEADVAFISALIGSVTADHGIDPKRIYATGVSNGGFFSHLLGVRLADRIAAIAPVIGGVGKELAADFTPSQPVSVFIIQGTKDPLVPYEGGTVARNRGEFVSTDDAVRLWKQANGTDQSHSLIEVPNADKDDGCSVEGYVWKNGKRQTEVILYKMVGGGHVWPGRPRRLPRFLVGDVCMDFDATGAVWKFFREHPKL